MVKIKKFLYIGVVLLIIALFTGCTTQKVVVPAKEYEPVGEAEDTEPEETVEPELEAPSEILEVPEEGDCLDSDNGKSYFERGMVTTSDEVFVDACNKYEDGTRIDARYPLESLSEYYCELGKVKTIHYKCLEGCEDGACKGTAPTS